MKKRVIIIGGIVIVAIAVLLPRLFSFSPEVEQSASVSTTMADTAAFSALVTPIASDVFALSPDTAEQEFAELATSTRVGSGTRIKTSETGRAIVEGTHEAFLDFNAEIVIASADAGRGSRIGLETGKTWSRVKKTFDTGEFYELETKNAVAVVRGTSFGLYFEHGDTTTLIVTEGEVRLIARDLRTGTVLYDTEVAVGPGEKAVRKGEEQVLVSAITDADKGEWFRFNNSGESIGGIETNMHAEIIIVPHVGSSGIASSSTERVPASTLSTTSPPFIEANTQTAPYPKTTVSPQ